MRTALALVLLLRAALAHADGAGDEAIALALFADGKQLAANDDYVHACEKYAAAYGIAQWLGIELNLADCYERLGQTASAWVMFRKASDDADKLGDPRGRYARERAERLAPALAHVTIQAAGARIVFDHRPIAAAAFGVPLPVDPGEHVVEATAPGHIAWSTRVTVAASASVDIAVPPLDAEPTPTFHVLPAPRVATRWSVVLPLGGVAVAAIATSLVLGLDAKHRYDAALHDHCDAQLVCDPQGYASIHTARHRGDLATLAGGIGVAAVAAAVIVYLAMPVTERATVAPLVAPDAVGLTVRGAL